MGRSDIDRQGTGAWRITLRDISDGQWNSIDLMRIISGQKRAECELLAAKQHLQAVCDASPDMIFVLSGDGSIIAADDTALRKSGFSADELRNLFIWNLSGNGYTPRMAREKIGEAVEEGITEFEWVSKNRAGLEFPVEVRLRSFPFTSPSGETERRVLAVIRDISEKKRLEDQLRQSQKMEAIGRLTGGIAHDFNNIINAILGFGTLALDKIEKDHPAADSLDEILAAALKASSLTQRLLAFSRKQTSDLKPVDINGIVSGAEKMLSRIIGEDIELITDLTYDEVSVMADAGQIEQVLMNLASNARDAMPKGGSLTISTENRELDDDFVASHGFGRTGKYVLISVSDTGCGIDDETQRKIFEPFFTTKATGRGTGLGLSMAYGIIKQHRGFINVCSEVGKGSTFRIMLPLSEDLAENGPEPSLLVPPKGGRETILIAEDDAPLLKLTRIVLESFGYSVISAQNGEEAVTKFIENSDRIGLVILDAVMPEKNGREAYEEIRKRNPRVKALFASGYAADITGSDELFDEGIDCIPKPISPKDLLNKVRELLDR